MLVNTLKSFFILNFTVQASARLSLGEAAHYSSYYSVMTLRFQNLSLKSLVGFVVEVLILITKCNKGTDLKRAF